MLKKNPFLFTFLIGVTLSAQQINIESIQPTVCLRQSKGHLEQLYYLKVDNKFKPVSSKLEVTGLNEKFQFDFSKIDTGLNKYEFFLPEVLSQTKVHFILTTGKDISQKDQFLLPQRHWTVYIMPNSHSDIGYSDLQTRVARNHAEYLDSAILFCQKTQNYPEGCRYKWNEEVTWTTEQFINNRQPEDIKALTEQVLKGNIEIAAWYMNLSDMSSHETVIRALYKSKELNRQYNIPFQSALNDDINGFTWATPEILNKAGIKYFAIGLNETRARSALRRMLPFYWQSPDGSKVLVWNGEHYMYANYALRLHESYQNSFNNVNDCLVNLQKRDDYPYNIVSFTCGGYFTDNSPPNIQICEVAKQWHEKWEYPCIRISVLKDFFTDLENRYASVLPTYAQGWPDYWTDGAASSAYETGMNRITQNEIISAEKLASICAIINPSKKYPQATLNQANQQAILYDEHTWGSWQSICGPESEHTKGQWVQKATYAYVAKENAENIIQRSMYILSDFIKPGNPNSIIVFNTLSWNRNDIVSIATPDILKSKDASYELVDAKTNKIIPFQKDKLQLPMIIPNPIPGMAQWSDDIILFVAEEVPAMGYTEFYFRKINNKNKETTKSSILTNTIENNFYKIVVDSLTGAIESIVDKELKADIVDHSGKYKLNEYIYENPIPSDCRIDRDNRCYKGFDRATPQHANIKIETGEVFTKITLSSQPKQAKSLKAEIILFNKIKKIEIINDYDKIETKDPEAVYFSFPFHVPQGEFTQEIADGTMIPEKEQLPHTSRDWMGVQNWVDVSNKNFGVLWSPIEALMVQYNDINTGKWLDTLEIKNQTLYSYAMNNYWFTNFKISQGGKHQFHYYISTHKKGLDKTEATRFGASQHTPLLANFIAEPAKSANIFDSFFNVDKSNIMIQTIKKAEDKDGFIIRLRELQGTMSSVSIHSELFKNFSSAYKTSITEENIAPITLLKDELKIEVNPYEIVTLRIK